MTGARVSGSRTSDGGQGILAASLVAVVIIWQANGFYLAWLARTSLALFWIADVAQWIAVPSVVALLLARRCGIRPGDYGYDSGRLREPVVLVETPALFLIMLFAFTLMRDVAWRVLGEPMGYFSWPDAFPDGVLRHVTWAYAALTAGFVESAFFIGLPWLVYNHVQPNPSAVVFTVLASTVFATGHWEQGPHVIVGAFFSHVVGCVWFLATRSLWSVAGAHVLVDLYLFYTNMRS